VNFGDAAPVSAASDAEVLDSLVSHLNMAAIGAARGYLLPHTGAVATPEGRVVLLPAPSGSGKSTLTAALVQAGLAYLSDETIGVDAATLAVLSYRKPLTLKPGSFDVHDHLEPGRGSGPIGWQVPVAALGDVGPPPDGTALRVALVAAPAYHPDVAGGAVLEPMSRAEAVYALATNSSSLVAVRPRPLESLVRFVGDARTCRVRFSDARAARDLVLDLLRGP
jgi:hypothetical protein